MKKYIPTTLIGLFVSLILSTYAFSLTLYDDFSGTYIDKNKWRQTDWVREIDPGSQRLLIKQASPSPIAISTYPYHDTNNLNFSDPNSVNSIQALSSSSQYTLTVNKSGAGTGTVTSSPAGINCGSTCTKDVKAGTKITLKAKADTNSTFAGWSGSGYSGTGTCVVVMNADTAVTAAFSEKPPAISVSPSSVNFGNVNLGITSEKTVTIQNKGYSDLVISSINIAGANASDFRQTNNCTTIPKGNSCTVTATFAPTSIGSKSATMSISSNDPKKPTVNVKLSGKAKSSGCTYSISPLSQQFEESAGTGSVNVTALTGCPWTATSNAGWITITSGGSGSGTGTVSYTVAANTRTSQRAGTMTIAAQTFTVTQSPVEATGLTISSLSTSSAAPFSPLTITGSGFDPEHSAISVLFIPVGSGVSIAVPALSAGADSLEVVVPPFLDQTSGFSSGVMNVQAIQVSGSSLMTSNTIGGLNVGPLPTISPSVPPGYVTSALINSNLTVLQTIQNFAGTSPSLSGLLPALNALSSDLNSTLQAVNSVVQNPTLTTTLPTANGIPIILNAAVLAAADRLILGAIEQALVYVATYIPTSLSSSSPVGAEPAATQSGDTYGQQAIDAQIAELTALNGAAGRAQGAGVRQGVIEYYGGMTAGLLGTCAGMIAGAAGASTLAAVGVGVAATWAAWEFLAWGVDNGIEHVNLGSALVDTGAAAIDYIAGAGGLALTSWRASENIKNAMVKEFSDAYDPTAPRGGICTVDPTTPANPTSTPVLCAQGVGASATAFKLLAPTTQGTEEITCTYTYSNWSPCQPNNTQTRTVISSNPPGCVGTPVLSQSCTPSSCTYTYSNWSPCQPNNTQTRTVISSSPPGCVGTPVLSQSCTYVPIPIFRGTAVLTGTASDPNIATSDWYHCLPDPFVITETAGPFTVDLVLDANPLVLGPISGTLYSGSSTITATSPQMTCTRIGEGYPREWVVPAKTTTETVPSYSGTISGHSDGTNIVIDPSIDLPSYCSETFTGTVTIAPVTGAVQFSGQDIVRCLINGIQGVSTTTYSLTRQ